MAILINGNGNPAIYPDQDADWFASIFGGQTAITGVGSQFAAEIQDANTIALADGVIITKEGRRIQLDANQSDIFEIPTGAQGTTNYYIIGYCLTTNDDSSQTAETFVQLMENATDTIDEDTFRGGADKVYVSLYRVTQTGFNLETPELLLPKVGSITQLNSDLTDLGKYTLLTTITATGNKTITTLDNYNEICFVAISSTANSDCYGTRELPTLYAKSNLNKQIYLHFGSTYDSQYSAVSLGLKFTSKTNINVTQFMNLSSVVVYVR